MTRDRGFVLVNALLIVAALAAAAVFLLARADGGRLRLQARQGTDQLEAYLDAYEALARTRLNADARAGSLDHPNEPWARPDAAVELDRGHVSGTMRDAQGLFNLNWLADPQDAAAQAAFERLLVRVGISSRSGAAIRGFLRPGGPERRAGYRRSQPPLEPVGGAVLMFAQLSDIPEVSPRDLSKLRQVATALPGDSRINVNSATPALLAAFLPDLSASMLDQVVQARRRAPFASAEAFVTLVETLQGAALEDRFKNDRIDTGSAWFDLQIRAELEGRTAGRTAMIKRQPYPEGAVVRWRLSTYD